MASIANNFEATSLDPSEIKESLKLFLQSQETFQDYNFEGAALNVLIDVLTRNTHYLSYLSNVNMNEAFIDSAQLRSSVVSAARKLSYTPKSITAPIATVDITVTPFNTDNLDPFIVLEKGSQFFTKYNLDIFQFTNLSDVFVTLDSLNGVYTAQGVEIRQGNIVQNSFTYLAKSSPIFEIPNKNVDTSTLTVKVQNSSSDDTTRTFVATQNIVEVERDALGYFRYENNEGDDQIEFGDDILGKSLDPGNEVIIEYLVVDKEIVNGAKTFTIASSVGGYTNVALSTTISSGGGSEKESIEQVRRTAPLSYASQGRAVIEDDYKAEVLKIMPYANSASVWGGENNKPYPAYGKVFISLILSEGFTLTDNLKADIVKKLRKKNMMTVRPVIVDPIFNELETDIKFEYDSSKTTNSLNSIVTNISKNAFDYSTNNLSKFLSRYNNTELIQIILDDNEGITSVDINNKMFTRVVPRINVAKTYDVSFVNGIIEGTVSVKNFTLLGTLATGELRIIDSAGVLQVVDYNSDDDITVLFDAGTVDYETGDIQLTNLVFSSVDETDELFKIYCEPSSPNIEASLNYAIKIDKVTVDTF